MRTRVDSCSYWKHKLALRMDDLSPEDQKALQAHMLICTSCKKQRMGHAQTHALLQHSLCVPAPPGMCQHILVHTRKSRMHRSFINSKFIQNFILFPFSLFIRSLLSHTCSNCCILKIRFLVPSRADPAQETPEPGPRSGQHQVTEPDANIADDKISAAIRGHGGR